MNVDLDLAFELADLAAGIALPRYHTRDYTTTRKSDGSPVTDVDLKVERVMRDQLARYRSQHRVIGEEYGRAGRSEWCWYLDPIDGTTRFLAGEPMWGTLIALAHRNEIVLGVANFPALGERWWASRGDGAFRDGEPISVSTTSHLSEAAVSVDPHQTLASAADDHPLASLAPHCARTLPHQGHSFLAVASGDADVAIGTGGHSWDYAAPKLIVEEAGGRLTDRDGAPDIDAGHAVVTNRLIHHEVLEALRNQTPLA